MRLDRRLIWLEGKETMGWNMSNETNKWVAVTLLAAIVPAAIREIGETLRDELSRRHERVDRQRKEQQD